MTSQWESREQLYIHVCTYVARAFSLTQQEDKAIIEREMNNEKFILAQSSSIAAVADVRFLH